MFHNDFHGCSPSSSEPRRPDWSESGSPELSIANSRMLHVCQGPASHVVWASGGFFRRSRRLREGRRAGGRFLLFRLRSYGCPTKAACWSNTHKTEGGKVKSGHLLDGLRSYGCPTKAACWSDTHKT